MLQFAIADYSCNFASPACVHATLDTTYRHLRFLFCLLMGDIMQANGPMIFVAIDAHMHVGS